jgi:2-amino-4-hydroxy-6-hydroxymethyldihydropteridine diphosphokinase
VYRLSASAETPARFTPVYLTLGSNIDPEHNLPRAVQILGETHSVLKASSVWETPPVGTTGANFLNAAVLIETQHDAERLKSGILRPIEVRLGRVRTADKNAPRPIDIDIAIFGEQIIDQELWTLPHLAVPLAEIAAGLRQPASQVTLQFIANQFRAAGVLTRRSDVQIR